MSPSPRRWPAQQGLGLRQVSLVVGERAQAREDDRLAAPVAVPPRDLEALVVAPACLSEGPADLEDHAVVADEDPAPSRVGSEHIDRADDAFLCLVEPAELAELGRQVPERARLEVRVAGLACRDDRFAQVNGARQAERVPGRTEHGMDPGPPPGVHRSRRQRRAELHGDRRGAVALQHLPRGQQGQRAHPRILALVCATARGDEVSELLRQRPSTNRPAVRVQGVDGLVRPSTLEPMSVAELGGRRVGQLG